MHPVRREWGALAIALGLLVAGCGGGQETRELDPESDDFLDNTVIASVGDYEITAADLDERLRLQHPDLVKEFSATTERSIRDLLRMDMDQLCLVSEAERTGYADTSRHYAQNLEVARRSVLGHRFTQDVLHAEVIPTEEELQQYYQDNIHRFHIEAKNVVRHILVATRAEAEEAQRRVEAGEEFADVATALTLDDTSRPSGGSVGYVRPGQPVRGMGDLPEFVDAAMAMDVGEMRIVQTQKGWHLLLILRRVEEGNRPYSEVRETLFEDLHNQRAGVNLQERTRELRSLYQVRLYDENLAAYLSWRRRAPESELFARAEQAATPQEKIEIYRDYLTQFGHSEHACEARFMIGFTYAEELNDRTRARIELNEFIKNCPDSELMDSARYLLDGLTRGK